MSFGFGIGDFLAIIELVNKSRKKWVDAPEEYRALRDETRSLSNILHDLEDVITQTDLTQSQEDDLNQARLACVNVLDLLQDLENKYMVLGLPTKGLRGHVRKAWKRSQAEPDDIRSLRSRISSTVMMLTALYNSLSIYMSRQIHDEILEMRKNQDDDKKMTIADWFAKATSADQHSDLMSRHLPGTGKWLLDSSQYQDWTNCQMPTLLCPGIPGSGKTMMAATVIDDLHNRFDGHKDVAVVYYYFDYALRSGQQINQVLGSCIRQLILAQRDLPHVAKKIYEQHKDRQTRMFDSEELWNLVSDLLELYSKSFIVVDALDECRNDDLARDSFISGLFVQQAKARAKTQIFATSRPIPQITDRFPIDCQLEIRASEHDVRYYLDAQMPRLPFVAKHVDLQDGIKDSITQVVDGMFLLAKLHFDSLVNCTKPRDVRRVLELLPRGSRALGHAYQSVRERIDAQPPNHRDLAYRILSFITYGERVFCIEELQHALVVESGMKMIDTNEDLEEESLLLSLCAGLVTIDPESRHVRFVHYTTQEYLEGVRDEWLPKGRVMLARSCMAYLSLGHFCCGRVEADELPNLLTEFPFVKHAAKLWGKYVSDPQEARVVDEVCKFLLTSDTLELVTQVMISRSRDRGSFLVFNPASSGVEPLHLAAFFGLIQVSIKLIEKGCKLAALDSFGKTPIAWAAERGHSELVRVMATQPAADNGFTRATVQSTAYVAATHGYTEVLKVILAISDIDFNLADDYGRTPLHMAASSGHTDIVTLLLEHPDIDVNLMDELGRSALHIAVERGHLEVTRQLLAQPGVDVSLAGKDSITALHIAVGGRHTEIVELLLAQPGIDYHHLDHKKRSVLHLAARYGRTESFKTLLAQCHQEINCVDVDGRTPLYDAVYSGCLEIVNLLLSQPDIKVNLAGEDTWPILHLAASRGHAEIVEVLLVHPDIKVNLMDDEKSTALHMAAINGDTEVVRTLLDHPGIDVNGKDEDEETPLSLATAEDHIEVIKLLENFIKAQSGV